MDLPVNYESISSNKRKLVREEYERFQEGKCCHCGGDLNKPSLLKGKYKIMKELFPPFFFRHPVHLHHDHDTGMTIGAVHSHCNAILWQYHGE